MIIVMQVPEVRVEVTELEVVGSLQTGYMIVVTLPDMEQIKGECLLQEGLERFIRCPLTGHMVENHIEAVATNVANKVDCEMAR